MKKWMAIILSAVLLMSLCACEEGTGNADQTITRAPETTAPSQENNETTAPVQTQGSQEVKVYGFVTNSVELIPGAAYDATKLPAAESSYEVPNCAIEGTNVVYSYGTYELTVYKSSTGDVIYSIFLLDPNLTTPEGLHLGDSESRVDELYGSDFTVEGTARLYTSQDTQLMILLQNGSVSSIEYRMVTQ